MTRERAASGTPFAGHFSCTHPLVRDLGRIESARAVVEVLPLPPDRILMLRQAAQRHSTRHSTRIEGNTLNSREVGLAVAGADRSPTAMQQEHHRIPGALGAVTQPRVQTGRTRPVYERGRREPFHHVATALNRGHRRHRHYIQFRTARKTTSILEYATMIETGRN